MIAWSRSVVEQGRTTHCQQAIQSQRCRDDGNSHSPQVEDSLALFIILLFPHQGSQNGVCKRSHGKPRHSHSFGGDAEIAMALTAEPRTGHCILKPARVASSRVETYSASSD
jgi:hypothetical protein